MGLTSEIEEGVRVALEDYPSEQKRALSSPQRLSKLPSSTNPALKS